MVEDSQPYACPGHVVDGHPELVTVVQALNYQLDPMARENNQNYVTWTAIVMLLPFALASLIVAGVDRVTDQ